MLTGALVLTACGGQPPGPALLVDGDGFFVVPDAPAGEWHPGPGVACLLPLEGTGDGPLCGRLDPGAESPTFYLRGEDGRLEPNVWRPTSSGHDATPRVVVEDAVVRFGASPESDERLELLKAVLRMRSGAEPPAVPPPGPQAKTGVGATPAAGTELAAWVPEDMVFVRFRSVATAFRFAGIADEIATRLEARAGRGRDHGELRLALHDLLLPSIWATNPDAETGVGEVALAIAPQRGRGDGARARVAVLLRITDPELHHMQTQAALSYESREDHLWRPDRDPFPALRERRNHRRILGDVEIVATDAGLAARFPAARSIAAAEGYRQASDAAGGPPVRGRHEALFLYSTDTSMAQTRALITLLVGSARARRENRGMRKLVEQWSGLPADGPLTPLSTNDAAPPWWADGVRSLHVATDVQGGHTTVEYFDEEAAEKLAAILGERDVPASQVDAACRANLRDLAAPSLLERPAGDLAERIFVVLGWKPVCPSGGTYTAHPITRAVRCSKHGSYDGFEPGEGLALPVADVVRDGKRVTFRLEIDWTRRE